jgi:hypothetical protein
LCDAIVTHSTGDNWGRRAYGGLKVDITPAWDNEVLDTMHQPVSIHRRESLTAHPPYGLFLDPHRGQHNWTAASSRVLLGFVAALGSVLIVIAFAPH